MRPLKREGCRSQYCGPTDNSKYTELFHTGEVLAISALCQKRLMRRSSVLFALWRQRGALCVAFSFNRKLPIQQSKSFAALCQSFLLAMSGHAGPIQMDLGEIQSSIFITTHSNAGTTCPASTSTEIGSALQFVPSSSDANSTGDYEREARVSLTLDNRRPN
jgi:hypothetical protein